MRQLLAILLLLTANQVFAQSGQYAEISSVSVDTTNERRVTINWNVAEMVNGQAFAVYHWENEKWVLVVDLLPTDMRSYQDVKAHPFEHAERYAVSTSIPGNPNAPLSAFHQTVFLQSGDYDKCRKSLTLNWSAYVGADVTDYMVFGREKSQPYSKIGTTTATTFSTNGLESGMDYNFIVVANLKNGEQSLSNIISYKTFNLKQPDQSLIGIDTVLNHQGAIELHCHIDTEADLMGYSIWELNGNNKLNDSLITNYSEPTFTFFANNDNAVYTLSAQGFCNESIFTTDNIQPIVIEANATAETMLVKWNRSLSNSEQYTVFCSVDGGSETPAATDLTDTSIELNFNEIADDRAQNFCIRVEAADGTRLSQSNTVCVERQADMWLPTAFTPNGDGLNDDFGPVVKSAQITDFEFIVYDRYGGRVFVSSSPDNRWDGTHSGKQVAEGGYFYYLKAELQNGQTFERKGSVNVVYP